MVAIVNEGWLTVEEVAAALPPKVTCLLIHARSTPETLKDEMRPSKNDLITALADFDTAVRLKPDFALAFRGRAYLHWRRNDNDRE